MALPFQPWPSQRYAVAAYHAGSDITDYYVRLPANGGDDILGNGTPQRPYATPARALFEAQRGNGRAVIHVGSGTYPLPRMANVWGSVAFWGDGGGDPADDGFDELLAPTAAAGGTVAGAVTGAFGADLYDGFTIEFLSGAAAGQRRTIADTQPGAIIPVRNFGPAPAPGDLFRVVQPAIIWTQLPANGIWIQNSGAPEMMVFGQPRVNTQADPVTQAVYIVNARLFGNSGAAAVLSNSNVACYGVELEAGSLEIRGGQLCSGAEDPDGQARGIAALIPGTLGAWAGWGLSKRDIGVYVSAYGGNFFGYIAAEVGNLLVNDGRFSYLGGWCNAIVATRGSVGFIGGINSPGAVAQGTVGLESSQGANVTVRTPATLAATGPADGINASQGGEVSAEGGVAVTSVAGAAANASAGGRIYISGAPSPTWTGGGVDMRVSAAETATSASFAAAGDTLAAASGDGSIITRIL